MNICRLNSFRSDMDRRHHNIRLFGWVRNNARGCTLPRRGLWIAFFAFDIFCGCLTQLQACVLDSPPSQAPSKPQQPRRAPQRRALPNPPDLLFHASPRGTDSAFLLVAPGQHGRSKSSKSSSTRQHAAVCTLARTATLCIHEPSSHWIIAWE